MEVAAAIKTRLLAIPAVTAIVNARIWTGPRLPQKPTLPANRVMRVSQVDEGQLRGSSGVLMARVQVDSVATTRAAATELAAAIDGDGAGSGLAFWHGDVGSPAFSIMGIFPVDVQEGFDPDELNQYRVMREYAVHFRRP